MTALDEIETLALKMAKEAQGEGVEIKDKIDAVKALAPYYNLLKRAKPAPEEDDPNTIGNLADKIQQAENGKKHTL